MSAAKRSWYKSCSEHIAYPNLITNFTMKLLLILQIMTHTLPQLPYAPDALEPYMSKETIEYHHGKHHQTYVTNLNNFIKDTPFDKMSLEEIILKSEGPMYNNAAQVWNHTFFFNELSPKAKTKPEGKLAAAIDKDFGSFDAFKEQFTKAATGVFGSGWTWLVKTKDGKLAIVSTPNGNNPMRDGQTPLMTIDVWEHAYYIDYRNKRVDFIDAFWKILDWKVVEERFK